MCTDVGQTERYQICRVYVSVGYSVPAQGLGVKVPEGHGAVAGPGQQQGAVRRQRARAQRAARGVTQHRRGLARVRPPHDGGAVRGAAEQVAAAGAEAAAVNPVAVARERRAGELREVRGVVHAQGFVAGAGREQRAGEGAAADLVRVAAEGAKRRHHDLRRV